MEKKGYFCETSEKENYGGRNQDKNRFGIGGRGKPGKYPTCAGRELGRTEGKGIGYDNNQCHDLQ